MAKDSLDRNDFQDKIIEIIASTLKIDKDSLTLDSAVGNVRSWDSLGNLKILIEVEAYVGEEFSIDDLVSVKSVSDWVAVSRKYLQIN